MFEYPSEFLGLSCSLFCSCCHYYLDYQCLCCTKLIYRDKVSQYLFQCFELVEKGWYYVSESLYLSLWWVLFLRCIPLSALGCYTEPFLDPLIFRLYLLPCASPQHSLYLFYAHLYSDHLLSSYILYTSKMFCVLSLEYMRFGFLSLPGIDLCLAHGRHSVNIHWISQCICWKWLIWTIGPIYYIGISDSQREKILIQFFKCISTYSKTFTEFKEVD